MLDRADHYIPPHYTAEPIVGATLWTAVERDAAGTGLVRACAERAIAAVCALLAFRPTRAIHVVVYESLDDSQRALGRVVPPSFLLAPRHTPDSAVIVAHAPRLDPRETDRARLLRLLCHEVAHVCSAERTGSTKRLGDGDVGMRIRPAIDEGFAVCVAAIAAEQPEALARTLAAVGAAGTRSLDELDDDLRALDSPRRPSAFAIATSRVWSAVQRLGVRAVFDELVPSGSAARPDEAGSCTRRDVPAWFA